MLKKIALLLLLIAPMSVFAQKFGHIKSADVLTVYFFWEPKVRSFPKELVRIERMADTRPAAALQELERYDRKSRFRNWN